ncbi:MAG: VWA domain-containing protein [Candidatus Methanomethylophilaceae archaeon]|nr:VWA domain-containing protein [Candidatus Methanomethylophilaceae archaeon]
MPPVDLRTFPFSAVLGMDDAKRAMQCILVNPNLRTVMIRGGQGSAKTVLARSVGRISGKSIINVPVNVSEEQLFGGMDIDKTIKTGKAVMQPGILSRADGNILYVDDVNLMDQRMLLSLLNAVIDGRVVLEREGISAEYSVDTVLIATMNPSDTDVSSHVLDRFDLCAYASFPDDDSQKAEILRRNSDFQRDPVGFVERYKEEEDKLVSNIERSKKILPLVTMTEDLIGVSVELAAKVLADGYRGDIAMVNTSKALAALNGRDEVMKKDVEEAAMLCLAHRRNYVQEQQQEPPPQEPDEPPEEDEQDEPPEQPPEQQDQQQDEPEEEEQEQQEPPPDMDFQQLLDDMVFEIGDQFRVIDYLNDGRRKVSKTSAKKGRRMMVESSNSSGRYARSRIPDEKTHDIAFDATVRAAAPYQRSRDRTGLAINIQEQDVREKVREMRAGCTILFLVDASGSLGVRKRMTAVKGAILSMLRDSYVKRDRIGMMAFRRDSAELILPPTRSVEYSYRKLEEMPTGGKTPLSEALVTVNEYMTSYSRSHMGEMCYIVVITDGRANVPLEEGVNANEEVLKLAEDMAIPQVKWIVIDASAGFIRFDNAERLAQALGGTYFRLEDLNADRLAESVRAVIR